MSNTTVAVIMNEGLDLDRLCVFLDSIHSIAGGLYVILTNNEFVESHLLEKSTAYHIMRKDLLTSGPTSISRGLSEALRVFPGADQVVVINAYSSKLPSISRVSDIFRSGLDYARLSSCLFLSRKYANFVAETDGIPSSTNAKKHGFLVPSLISELIHSPREAIEENTFIKFAMVGATGFVLNELVVTIFKFWIARVNLVIGDAVGIELSIINNFIWNDMFTFKNPKQSDSKDSMHKKLVRFLKYNLVSLVSTSVNLAVFYYLYSDLGIFYFWSLFVAILFAFLINYIGSSRWAWGKFTGDQSASLSVLKN